MNNKFTRRMINRRNARADQGRDSWHRGRSQARAKELREYEAWLGGRSQNGRRRRKPRGGRAQTLDARQLERVLAYIDAESYSPESDRLKIELSFHAGLRASEIAGLRLEDVTDADGQIATTIHIRSGISKGGRDRFIPMHPRIKDAIKAFRARYPYLHSFAVSHAGVAPRIQSVNAVTVWFHCLYRRAGLNGCSSHTGRRTFVTELARRCNEVGSSIRDVQVVVGHKRLDTTAAYIEPGRSIGQLISSLGNGSTHETEQLAYAGERA